MMTPTVSRTPAFNDHKKATFVPNNMVMIPFIDGGIVTLQLSTIAVVEYNQDKNEFMVHSMAAHLDPLVLNSESVSLRSFIAILPRLGFTSQVINRFFVRELQLRPDTKIPDQWEMRDDLPIISPTI